MAEAVRLANAGLIVSMTDPGKMSDAILRLAGNAHERALFGENAQAGFEANFTLRAAVSAYAEL
jgi:hypothetical protein